MPKNKPKHHSKIKVYPSLKRYRFALIVMTIVACLFLFSMIVVDVLPSELILTLVVIMAATMIATSILFASKKRLNRALGVLLALVFLAFFGLIISYSSNTYALLNKISDTGTNAEGPSPKTVDVIEEPFNVYITGIDQWAYEKGLDLERSDVNMIVTINPLTKNILLTSIPRDTYVKLHRTGEMDKLTHTGIYGVDETLNTIQDWFGVDMNYYVKMNFTAARDIINALDGIDVYSPVAFKSSIREGYEYRQGWNHMYGKQAIYFARERKAFEQQDSIRVENQQRVMKAVINKMTSSTTLLINYGDVMEAAGEQLQTNLSSVEMSRLAKMQITELATWTVESQKIEGEFDEDYVASLAQTQKYSIFRPDEESAKKCSESIKRVMNPPQSLIEEKRKNSTKSFYMNIAKRALGMDKEATEEESEE